MCTPFLFSTCSPWWKLGPWKYERQQGNGSEMMGAPPYAQKEDAILFYMYRVKKHEIGRRNYSKTLTIYICVARTEMA
jgi:hypothetical protein